MQTLGLSSGSSGAARKRLVNVGSSMGGCARYLAGAHGIEVLGIEVQRDLHECASELTDRCKEPVRHLLRCAARSSTAALHSTSAGES